MRVGIWIDRGGEWCEKNILQSEGHWFDLINLGRMSNNSQWLSSVQSCLLIHISHSVFLLVPIWTQWSISLPGVSVYMHLCLKNAYSTQQKLLSGDTITSSVVKSVLHVLDLSRRQSRFQKMMSPFAPSKSGLGHQSGFEKCKNRKAWRLSSAFPLSLLEDIAIIAL